MTPLKKIIDSGLFQCSVCLDVFTIPVSLPCGHTFCQSCILAQWTASELCENSFAREMKVSCAVKSCLVCVASYCEVHVTSHTSRFTKHTLVQPQRMDKRICRIHERPLELYCRYDQSAVCVLCMNTEHSTHHTIPVEREWAERKSELLRTMKHKQKTEEKRVESLIKELEREIAKLNARNSELEKLSCSEDHFYLIQVTLLCFSIFSAGCAVLVHFQLLLCYSKTCGYSINNILLFIRKLTMTLSDLILAVDMTLDPDTSNPWLVVSADRKCVTDGNVERNVPNNAERFDMAPCVLAREPISRGRGYWEVGVSGKTAWDLGVARKSVNRKGLVTLSPEDGYWAVCLRGGTEYRACDGESVLLSLKTLPQRIGIYVDYEKGQVSFYDTSARTHIYSFTGQRFTESLLAYFNPDMNDTGNNNAPLVIQPVSVDNGDKTYDTVTI
uniref:Uncharacterized protein n=1 Tax=Sinocyclocheilus grahami TaxID=75366 RepID=A0A672Q5B1_SINGR